MKFLITFKIKNGFDRWLKLVDDLQPYMDKYEYTGRTIISGEIPLVAVALIIVQNLGITRRLTNKFFYQKKCSLLVI